MRFLRQFISDVGWPVALAPVFAIAGAILQAWNAILGFCFCLVAVILALFGLATFKFRP